METLLSVCLAVGLSAACGFRIFVPLLVVSLASHAGHLELASGFEWIGSDMGLATFAVATLLEIAGYYIPWVDNALDSLATPAAIIAGTIVSASVITDMSPVLKWSLAVIAGGGAAGAVQVTTVATRALSSIGTGGLANPLFATAELAGASLTSVMALMVPVVAVVIVTAVISLVAYTVVRKRRGATRATSAPAQVA